MPSGDEKQDGKAQDIETMTVQARRMIRAADRASLATVLRESSGASEDPNTSENKGWPYVSFVLSACDHDGAPLLLLSDLADHSRNIREDNRVSLLFSPEGEPGNNKGGEAGDNSEAAKDRNEEDSRDDPLAHPRLSLLGRLEEGPAPHLRERFLARHPASADYAGFGDFRIYRLDISRGRLVAGFGRAVWIAGDGLLYGGECGDLREREAAIIAHMNADHGDAVRHYAETLLGRSPLSAAKKGEPPWLMTGVDVEGCDLRRGGETARLDFAHSVASAEDIRAELVRLAGKMGP